LWPWQETINDAQHWRKPISVMGTGTDVAIESAKITLVKGDLQGIVKAKELSHAVMKILIKIYFLLSFIMYSESRAAGFYILFATFTDDCCIGNEL
jgi:hypothetical protein